MDNDFIVTKMQGYIHRAAQELSAWLSDLLPKTSDDWWNECVLDKLSYAQREIAKEKGFSKLTEFDLAALLRIADKSWYEMRNVAYLPTKERECIRDMMRVRNNWAHLSASIPGKDMIIDDLKTLYQFFEQILIGIPSLPIPTQLTNVFVLYESMEKAKEKLKYDLLAAYRRQKKNTTFSRTIANALVVLTQIRKHPGITTEKLSEILELSPRTIQRYIESLRIAGEWITYNPSKKGWELQDGKSILFGDFDN